MQKHHPTYDILAETAPCPPKNLPKLLSLAAQNAPDHMKPAILNSVFSALGALMHGVRFRYSDERFKKNAHSRKIFPKMQ